MKQKMTSHNGDFSFRIKKLGSAQILLHKFFFKNSTEKIFNFLLFCISYNGYNIYARREVNLSLSHSHTVRLPISHMYTILTIL